MRNTSGTVDAVAGAGTVTLVGAGPGDPELLTLKAVRAIGSADVILLDDLVNPEVLRHARADARIIPVGKRGGCRSTPQEFIERLMATEAKAGRCVVRLKGGDPFIFGRGGEERTFLRQQGIPVHIVNGISSGLAAPASIGVPLTHRDCTQGVIFVTGHGQAETSQPDWGLLAQLNMTLVIYMGISRCAQIRAALVEGGKSGDTPVAVIRAATTARQSHLLTTLGDMDQAIRDAGVESPAILVIGDVVRFADADAESLREKFPASQSMQQ